MIKEELTKELEGLISAYFSSKGIELFELICRQEGRKLVLMILADYPGGGITLGECALLNRRLGEMLEEKDIIKSEYVLEVSSPGLDRPLKNKKDFLRCLNKEAVFFFNDLINGKLEWQGVITGADETNVTIKIADQILEIPLTKINKAHLVLNKQITGE